MEASRLSRACALVSGALGQSPAAQAGATAGEVSRAMMRAAGIDSGSARDLLEPRGVEHVHATWFVEPLARLHPASRAPLLALLPGPVARYAALALERATGEAVADAPAARGATAARIAASLVPPLGHAAPAFLDEAGASDPLSWLSRRAAALPRARVYSSWPREARSLEASFGQADAPAAALVTLSACLAARADEARAVAARMPLGVGAALMAARARWTLALEPGDAADLYGLITDIKGDETS